jgi:hypothetical protein
MDGERTRGRHRRTGIITSGIEAGLREMGFPLQRGDASKAARAAVDRGLIERVPGKRRAQRHYLKSQTPPVTPSSPDYPPSTPDSLAGVIDLIPGTVIAQQETR